MSHCLTADVEVEARVDWDIPFGKANLLGVSVEIIFMRVTITDRIQRFQVVVAQCRPYSPKRDVPDRVILLAWLPFRC